MFCVEHIGVGEEQQGWVETNSGKTGSLDQLPNKAVVSRKDVTTDWTVVETKIKTNKNKTSQELRKLPYIILSFLPVFTFANLDKVLMASMRL